MDKLAQDKNSAKDDGNVSTASEMSILTRNRQPVMFCQTTRSPALNKGDNSDSNLQTPGDDFDPATSCAKYCVNVEYAHGNKF